MKPDDYICLPKCGCRRSRRERGEGNRDVWRIDWYRTSKIESKVTTCQCDALPFYHRRGSRYYLTTEQPLICQK